MDFSICFFSALYNKDSEDNSSKTSEDSNYRKSEGNSSKKSEGERKHESGKHKVVEHKNKKIKLEYDSAGTNNHLSDGLSPKDIEKAEKKSKKSRLHTKKKKKTKGLKTSKSRDEKRLSKKIKQKRKHSKHNTDRVKKKKSSRRLSHESKRSRSNSFCSEEYAREEEIAPKKRHASPEIDFYKDKFDKIKERRRGSSKNNADSDSKTDKGKSNLPLPEKDKNLKLKETIEKLKAKSEKSESPPVYEDLFESKKSTSKKEKKRYDDSDIHKKTEKPKNRQTDEYEFIDDANPDDASVKVEYSTAAPKKAAKKQSNAKNESATEALEQAVKDISKWLDDDPKVEFSSESTNSPLQTVASEESTSTVISSKPDEDILSSLQEKEKEKGMNTKKDGLKKRHHKDPTKSLSRRKELQRTIERLQPGKSKGNLLSNMQSCPKQEDNSTPSVTNKVKEVKSSLIMKTEEGSPKLSLGTVLPTVGFGLGKQHNFTQEPTTPPNVAKVEVVDTGTMTCENEDNVSAEVDVKSDIVVESEEAPSTEVKIEKPSILAKQYQEKATPNLSAWFKAFGAPKSGGTTSTSTSTTTTTTKKKFDDIDQEDLIDRKTTSPDNVSSIKNEQSVDESLIVEGGDSPLPSLTSNSRLRRTSTGSSISERSSFSQDLDSPRHQPSHPSPLIQSPASPRTEDHQKQYPLMNVTVRVGFYQDTASVKSSPEKSCSPREAPQSPYSAYSQHVYAASANGSIQQANQSQLLSIEGPCKSPLPTYGQTQPPPFYDGSKAGQANKSVRQEDYTAFGPDSMYQRPSSPFSGSFSPAQSPYSQHSQHSPYSHVQHSPQTFGQPTAVSNALQTIQSTENKVVEKSAIFPVKKRTYNEHSELVTDANSGIIQNQGVGKVNDTVAASGVGVPPAMYFDEEKVETPSSCAVISNNPSVITTATSKNVKKTIQLLTYSPKMDTEAVPTLPNFTPETVERGTLDLCSQYTDIASDYSARKIQPQINDFSLVGLSKPHIETNAASMYQDMSISKHMSGSTLFSEVKNATELASKDFSMRNKTIDMINMGYSNKFMDTSKINVDMVNMGYLMPDSGNMENKISAHMSKIDSNMDETKSRSYDLYNMACNIMPFAGRPDQINPSVLKVAPSSEYSDKNKKPQAYDKSHSVLQYTNQPMELMNSNRSASGRPSYLENINIVKENRSSIVPTYKDWNVETIKKNDPYNLSAYKEMQNKSDSNKINTSPMISPANAGLVQKTNTDNLNYESPNNINDTDESQRSKSDNMRVPIIRIEISSSIKPQADTQQLTPSEYIRPRNVNVNMPMHQTKTVDSVNYDRNMPMSAANTYKPQSNHPIDASLRNIPNIPQMMEKYVKDDRMLSAFPPSVPSPYHDKNLPIAYHKNMHGGVPSNQMFQPVSMPVAYGRDTTYSPNIQTSVHNLSVDPIPIETEKKSKSRKKKAAPESPSAGSSNQSFHSYGSLKSGLSSTAEQAAIALKSSNILPGSAFNYGPSALSSGLYGDSSRILEEMRSSSSNQYMAANYMAAAAAAAHQSDKGAKPAHQANPFQFLSHHPQARPAYPLMGMDPSSALYQQYLHRHQEELLRHSTSQMMGIFPPGYPGSLGVRQPYDSISRPSWL